jgi:hypothetical protein
MTIVSDLQAGLANRIKNIVSCLRIDSDVEVVWNPTLHSPSGLMGTKLNNYFSNLKECNDKKNKVIRSSWRFEVFPDELPENFSIIDDKIEKIFGKKFNPIIPQGKTIDFEYERIPFKLKESYIKCFDKLKINKNILKSVEQFSNNFDDNTVSVHIRTWHDDMGRNEKLFDMNKFLDIMSEYSGCKFFVSTDYYPAIEYLKDEIGEDKIINYPHTNENLDCFVEMLLLSKNKVLIGSPISTFTEVAWWFSECKSDVRIAWK